MITKHPWFGPKRIGWGWRPVSWEGWIATTLCVAVVIVASVMFRELSREISKHIGRNPPIDQFLQELQMRSKEPSPKPGSVTLMTIHAAKGREFDYVYLVGLAEDIIPAFQSKQKGDKSAEMEEERRSCFVAITRTKESLTLSYAGSYRGWSKPPSRFLVEMGFVQ